MEEDALTLAPLIDTNQIWFNYYSLLFPRKRKNNFKRKINTKKFYIKMVGSIKKTKVQKIGPDRPVQPENRSTGPPTGPVQIQNRPPKNRGQNR